MASQNPIRRKLVIVGDGACGKTSLLCCFALGEFPKEYHPTIFENYVAEIRLDGRAVQLALWDTAGQEEYERLRPLSYARSHVILIAFAIDTPDSLDNVTVKWIEEVRAICGAQVPVLLVGCKADLRPPPDSPNIGNYVSREEAEQVAVAIGARAYKECSALKIEGVDDVFEAATRASMTMTVGTTTRRGRGRGSEFGSTGSANGFGYHNGHARGSRGSHPADVDDAGRCCVIL